MKKRILSILLILITLIPLSARPKVALVLSGGGARGFMHVPIIQALEERGIYPDIVTGTSMGGLVGGLYAAGYTGDELAEFILSQDFFQAVFTLTQPVYSDTGRAYDLLDRNVLSLEYGSEGIGQVNSILSDVRINAMLRSAVVKAMDVDDFSELSIPFATVGTDFKTGEKVVFTSGSIFDALRSTMSMPVVFPPYVLEDGRYIVDGGMVDNLPVDLAIEMGADIIIAVDVNEDVRTKAETTASLDTLSGALTQYMILNTQAFSIQQHEKVDYLIVPPTGDVGVVDFSNAAGILEKGYEFVRENAAVFDQIAEDLSAYLPLDKPSPSYDERTYSYIEGYTLPPQIEEKYSDLFRTIPGQEYNDDFIARFDSLLETIRKRENLKSLTYTFRDNMISVKSEKYISMQSVVFLGLTGGGFMNYSPAYGFSYGFDPSLSVSTTLALSSMSIDLGIRIGQQNLVCGSLKVPVLEEFYFNTSLYGSYGGYSAVSSHYIKDKYSSGDWGFGAAAGFSYSPSSMHSLNADILFDIYLLGSEHRYGNAQDVPFWNNNEHYIPSFELSYHYNNLAPDMATSLFYSDVMTSLQLGYEKGFLYSFKADWTGFARISFSNYIDFNLSVFTSRYPYELLSSYSQNYFGTISRDSIYADISYRRNLPELFSGLFVSAGGFILADDGDALPDRAGSNGIIPYDGVSLVPFISMDTFRAGLTLSFGHFSDFGILELMFRISFQGEMALALRVR